MTRATRPPLLVLHGLFGSKQNWQSMSKSLARATRSDVWAVDLRNHGESPHLPEMSYPLLAHDIAAFVRLHHLHRPTVIGHSMGGKAAMHLALTAPDLVSGVMSLDMSPNRFNLSLVFQHYIAAMRLVDDANLERQSDADKMLATYIPDTSVRLFLLTNLKRQQDGRFKFRIPLKSLLRSLPELGDFPALDQSPPPRYDGRVALVGGRRADYVREDMLPSIRQLFPNATLEMMDAGHWLHAERPKEIVDKVVAFVERVEVEDQKRFGKRG
ncbi:Alpha/Beta hydrolase protein [Blastocladiella britannica]|nr:Alpha/Beta hydrolase protein [Blastocladiella britannica]